MKPTTAEHIPYYQHYIDLVKEEDLCAALENSLEEALAVWKQVPAEKWDYAYAEGKWTLKALFQHIVDTERIMAYRALCFARGEQQALPGFEENDYARVGNAYHRNAQELLEEFTWLRKANIYMFKSFSAEDLSRTGYANHNIVSPRAIGFMIAGHELHHRKIARERYLQ